MSDNTITKLQQIFAPIAAKIGQGAQYGWDVVMRQQTVYAWEGLLAAVVGVILGIAIAVFVPFAYKKEQKDGYGGWEIAMIISLIFGGSGSLLLISFGTITAITHFLNPAYYAIDFFIRLTSNN